MLPLKQARTQLMIDGERARLTRVAVRLQQIEQEGKMPDYAVLLKRVDVLLVASIRAMTPLPGNAELCAEKLTTCLPQRGIQAGWPLILLLHSRLQQRDDRLFIDRETALPLSARLLATSRLLFALGSGLVSRWTWRAISSRYNIRSRGNVRVGQ